MGTTETETQEQQVTVQDVMTKGEAVKYVSPSPDYYVTRVKPNEGYVNGQARTLDSGVGYQFRHNEFVVQADQEGSGKHGVRNGWTGRDLLPTGPAGEMETAIQFLDRQNPYWVRRETQIAPDASGVFLEVNRLGLLGEVDKLREMLAMERANWQREPVITAIEQSLETLEGPPPAA